MQDSKWNFDLNTVTQYEKKYANRRNISFFKLFQARPLGELREAIDLFRTLQYRHAIQSLIDNIISQQVSQDYYHMALCYISRACARMGDSNNAKLVLAEAKKVLLPATYLHSAAMLVEEAERDIAKSEKE